MSQQALYFTTHDTAIGRMLMVASVRGLRYLTLLTKGEDASQHLRVQWGEHAARDIIALDGFFETTKAAITRYVNDGAKLTLPVDLASGTPLQRMVWLEIARIPYGETISYTTLAERVGFPRAVRAVASACGANPVPLVIPCHRVLAKDGTLGGFSLGGLTVKQLLLDLESEQIRRVA